MVEKDMDELCTTAALSHYLGITSRRIQQLVKSDVLPQIGRGKFRIADAVQAYIKFLSFSSSTYNGEEVDGKLEKALLTRIQKEKAELELGVMRGELHRGEDVRAVMSDMIGNCRARLLSLPTKLSPMLLGQSEMAMVQDIIKRAIYEALTELSNYNPKKIQSAQQESNR
jgi:phage terminase Nu1 subunit (DNA packaging protein)